MTIHLGDLVLILTAVSLFAAGVRMVDKWRYANKQEREFLLKTCLFMAKMMSRDDSVPDTLAEDYKKINGNKYMTSKEKVELLGERHNSGIVKAAGEGAE